MKRAKPVSDEGISLIELMVVISLISILATISMVAFRAYDRAQELRRAEREVVAILRNSQVRAGTESATYQCFFDTSASPHSLKIYRDSAIPPTTPPTTTYILPSTNVVFVASGTSHGVTHGFDHGLINGILPRCFFEAKGTATQGTVGVKRIDKTTEYDIRIDGITSRVTYDE